MSLHLALLGLSEGVLHLAPLMLEECYLNLATGQLFSTNLNFGFNSNYELTADCPVPFRLSLNLHNFLGISIEGRFAAAQLAAARCLRFRLVVLHLRPLLWHVLAENEQLDGNALLRQSQKAVTMIEGRLSELAHPDSGHLAVQSAIASARASENLAQMDLRYNARF